MKESTIQTSSGSMLKYYPCLGGLEADGTIPFARYQVSIDDGFDNVLVVDGIPVIDESKRDRLLAKIAKEFGRKGAPVKPEDFYVPWDQTTNKSKG
jgi:hypothetical protein